MDFGKRAKLLFVFLFLQRGEKIRGYNETVPEMDGLLVWIALSVDMGECLFFD